MFKALDRNSGNEIILLDRKWAGELDGLRLRDQKDELVCQGCRFPVRVRAGKINRWHFAHKELRSCHYGRETPGLLQARAVLYRRLQERFGDQVTLEKQLASEHFRRPVDCWVERPEVSFAYWIFERGTRPQVWGQLRRGFAAAKASPQWLFVVGMLDPYVSPEDEVLVEGMERLYLTTTEREFMQKSFADDELFGAVFLPRKSLHYLDPETEELTTFRRLRPVELPRLFEGQPHRTALSEVHVSGKTGELGHPGEPERARELHAEKVRCQAQQAEAAARVSSNPIPILSEQVPRLKPEEPLIYDEAREGTCAFCGTRTRDWWYFDPTTQTCKCNLCLKSGIH